VVSRGEGGGAEGLAGEVVGFTAQFAAGAGDRGERLLGLPAGLGAVAAAELPRDHVEPQLEVAFVVRRRDVRGSDQEPAE
jgi:hypothetical protein